MRQHKLIWASSYDRGVEVILNMWPDIIAKYPDATLDIAYGWDTWLSVFRNNPERMAWYEKIVELMSQKGVKEHGRLGKKELKELRKTCGIWTYPTYFTEINCITALECQQDGCVPCVMNYAALQETVQSGIKVDGDIYDLETKELYKKELLSLMGDSDRWQKEQQKGIEFAKEYKWEKIASKWSDVFQEEQELPFVTVYTPTMRTGWEEDMAQCLHQQTYKGKMEWIIVDDYKEDRKQLFEELGKKYGIQIEYIRGKHDGYKHGLSHANNIAMKNAKGELFVAYQDCMLIEPTCIQDLVMLYVRNPKCLIATVDVILHKDGSVYFKNPRINYTGIRHTNNPFDFEMNVGAIPMAILKQLNGWYELLDDGLGYDNTEIAHRALMSGYSIIIDETNLVKSTWHEQKGHFEGQHQRYEHIINNLPIVRDEKLDVKFKL